MENRKKNLWPSLCCFVVEQRCVPWTVSNRIELWLENWARERIPPFYRLLRFGRVRNIVRPITQGPNHHFFGYYDKSPWNASGSLLLAHEVSFNDRPPLADDSVTIGVVKLNQDNRFEPLGKTYAWNWQQGSMLQWHPIDPEHLILYNDRRNGHFVGIVRKVDGCEIKNYDRPFYAVTPDGCYALSLNFSRLHQHRPGYGYAGIPDVFSDVKYPKDDGIFLMDLNTGTSKLIISLYELANNHPCEEMRDVHHWVNHIQVSPNGKHFAFFHLWRIGKGGWGVRLYISNLDGTGLNCLLDTNIISHYDWMDDRKILVWTGQPGIGNHFLLCDHCDGSKQVIGKGILIEDGHCSFSPDRKWVLNDTYPDRFDLRTLMLFRVQDGKRFDLARLYSLKSRWWGEIRCDLHPRWSRDGKQACIDSVHTGERQMYAIDLSSIVS